jgi:hypothetical protein
VPASVSEFASVRDSGEPHSAVAPEDLASEDLRERVRALRRRHEIKYAEHPQKSSCGIVLESTLKIRRIVPGGPLDREFDGSRIEEDDLLIAIDGSACAPDTVQKALVGEDVVGSKLRLTIEKAADGRVVIVTVRRGSYSRMLVVGEIFLMFKQVLSDMGYGKVVAQADLLKLENHCVKMCRLSSEHLEKLRRHVADLEKLALGSKPKAAPTTSATQTEMAIVATLAHATQTEVAVSMCATQTVAGEGANVSNTEQKQFQLSNKLRAASARRMALNSQQKCLALHVSSWRCQTAAIKREAVKASIKLVTAQAFWAWQVLGTRRRFIVYISRKMKRFWDSWYEAGMFAIAGRTFGEWKTNAGEIQQDRKFLKAQRHRSTLLKRVARRWSLSAQSKSFVQWRHHFTAKLMQSIAANKVQKLSKINAQAQAFGQLWFRARNTRMARQLSARQSSRVMHATWSSWEAIVDQARHFRAEILKTILRRQLTNCAHVFGEWKQEMIHLQKLRKAASHIAHALSLRTKAETWIWWRKRLQQPRAVSKVVARWKSRCVSALWSSWQTIAVEARRMRRAGLIVYWRWKRRGIGAAWRTWYGLVHAAKCMRQSAKTVKRRSLHLRLGTAFTSWKAKWKQIAGVARLRASIDLHRQCFGVAAVISGWELVVLETRRLQKCAQSVMRRRLHLHVGAAFAGWKAETLHRKRLIHATTRCRPRRKPILSGHFDAWKSGALERLQVAHVTRRVARRQKHISTSLPFLRWVAQVRYDKKLACAMRKALRRCILISVSARFAAWAAKVDEAKQMKRSAARVIVRLRFIYLSYSWRTWLIRTREHTRYEYITMRHKISALRWLHISEFCQSPILRDAFHIWSRYIQEGHATLRALHRLSQAWDLFVSSIGRARKMRKVACSLHIRTTNRQMKCAFEAWFGCVHTFGTQEQRAASIVKWSQRRLPHKLQRKAWIGWCELLSQRRVVAKAAARRQSRWVSTALSTWQMYTAEARRTKRVEISVCRQGRQRGIAAVLSTWQMYTAEARRMKRVEISVCRQGRQRGIAAVLSTWQMYTAEARRMKRVEISVCRQGRQRGIAAAWHRWNEYHFKRGRVASKRRLLAHKLQRKAWIGWCELLSQRRVVAKAAARRQSRWVSTALSTWQMYTAEARRTKRVEISVCRQGRQRGIAAVLSTWQMYTAEARRTKRVEISVCRQGRQRGIAAAWHRWNEYHFKRGLVARLWYGIAKGVISCAFSSWKRHTKHRKALATVARKVFVRRLHVRLRLPLAAWKERMLSARRQQHATRGVDNAVKAVLQRRLKKFSSTTWSFWLSSMLKRQRFRSAARKIMTRWSALQASQVWNRWRYECTQQHRAKRVTAHIIRRWSKLGIASRFNAWKSAHLEFCRNSQCASRIILRWRHLHMSTALGMWIDTVIMRRSAANMLLRWQGQSVLAVFNAWRNSISERHRAFTAIPKILARRRHREVARGFAAFIYFWMHQRRVWCWTEKMLAHIPQEQTARAFERWFDQLVLWRYLREEQNQVFKRWAKQLFDVREQCKRVLDRFIDITMQRYVALLFNSWADNVRERSNQLLQYQLVVRHFTLAALRVAFDVWTDFVQIAKKDKTSQVLNRSKMTRVAALLQHAFLTHIRSTAMQEWVRNSSLLSRLREEINNSVASRLKWTKLSQAFSHWTSLHRALMDRKRLSDSLIDKAVKLHRRWKLMFSHELFSRWAEMITANRQLRIVAELVASCDHDRLALAFDGWKGLTSTTMLRNDPQQQQTTVAGENEDANAEQEARLDPIQPASEELNPPESNTWWSNMQRNMSFPDLRFALPPDRHQRASPMRSSMEGQTRRSPPLVRSGQLRFREAITEL